MGYDDTYANDKEVSSGYVHYFYGIFYLSKKILKLIYSSNEWYDNLEDTKRFFFLVMIPIGVSQILLVIYGIWQVFPIIALLFLAWRLIYFKRPKIKYVFDIETDGLISYQLKENIKELGKRKGYQKGVNYDFKFIHNLKNNINEK